MINKNILICNAGSLSRGCDNRYFFSHFPFMGFNNVISTENLEVPEWITNFKFMERRDEFVDKDKIEIVDLDTKYELIQQSEQHIYRKKDYKSKRIKKGFARWHFGDMNPEIKFLVFIPEEKNGLFYFVNYFEMLLKISEEDNLTPIVDFKNFRSLYIEDSNIGLINAWEDMYCNFSDYDLDEVYQSQNVIIASNDMNSVSYEGFSWDDRIRIYQQYFIPNIELSEYVDEILRKKMNTDDRILGVLCRGTDYSQQARPYLHPVPLDAHEMAEIAFRKFMEKGYSKIYLSTEDENVLEWFKKIFGKRLLYIEQERFVYDGEKIGNMFRRNNVTAKKRGWDYYATIFMLSRCTGLLATPCAGTRAAIVCNGKHYEEVCVVNKGFYGRGERASLYLVCKTKNLLSFDDFYYECKDGIKVKKLADGRLHVSGCSTKQTSIYLCKKQVFFLPIMTNLIISIRGFENYSINTAHFTFKTYGTDVDDKFWCKDGQKYTYISRPEYFDAYIVIDRGVEIDSILSVQLEFGNRTSLYETAHTSINEIELTDIEGKPIVVASDDILAMGPGYVRINGDYIQLKESECEKIRKAVRYREGYEYFMFENQVLSDVGR